MSLLIFWAISYVPKAASFDRRGSEAPGEAAQKSACSAFYNSGLGQSKQSHSDRLSSVATDCLF